MTEESIWGVAYHHPLGAWAACARADGEVVAWDVVRGRARRVGAHAGAARGVAFLPGGGVLSVGDDGRLRAWASGTPELERRLASARRDAPLWGLACRSDGRQALTGSANGTVEIWDLITGRREAVLGGHEATVTGVAYGPSGSWAVSTSGDATARVWDLAERRCVAMLIGHRERVWSAAWRQDGRALATASADGTARVWEVGSWRHAGLVDVAAPEPRAISYTPPGITDISYLADGRLVLAVLDGSLRVVDPRCGDAATVPIVLPQAVLALATHPGRASDALCGLFEGGTRRVDLVSGRSAQLGAEESNAGAPLPARTTSVQNAGEGGR
jgi:WD40 repeat protein